MGLFDIFKGKKAGESPAGSVKRGPYVPGEFDRDIEALLNRDDIQCRQDICAAEYEKAMKLVQFGDMDSIHRAYDIMGRLGSEFDHVPSILFMGQFAEESMGDAAQAARWYKRASDLGDGQGARCFADMLMMGNGVPRDPATAEQYYKLAAERGVAEAAFVMGEFARSKGKAADAKKYYEQALKQGYAPAQERINQMKSGR